MKTLYKCRLAKGTIILFRLFYNKIIGRISAWKIRSIRRKTDSEVETEIEKLMSGEPIGLFVVFCDQEPPRTHNIAQVFKHDVEVIDEESKDTEEFILKLDQYNAIFVKLLAYYITERYPSYKEKLSQAVDQQEAADVLTLTEEVFIWLISLKQFAPA